MHVEIEATDGLADLYDVKYGYGGVPGRSAGGTELDFEEASGGLEDAGLDLRVGEVGADGLGVKVEGGAAELLVPVGTAGDVNRHGDGGHGGGLALAGEVEDELELAAGAFGAGLVELGEEGADVGG